MSDAQNILQALKQTIVGSSTEAIKQAQSKLQAYQNQQSFIVNLALILQETTIDTNIQKSAAVYLNKHAKNIVSMKNQQLINFTAEAILKLLTNYKISCRNKSYITMALDFLLSADKTKIIRAAFQPNLIALLAQADQQADDQVNFQFLVFFGQVLMSNPGFTEEVSKFINKTFYIFVKLTIRVLNLLDQVLLAQNEVLTAKLLLLSKQYIYLLKIYLKRFLFVDIESNKLLFAPEIVTVIKKAFQLRLPNNLHQSSLFHVVASASVQQKTLNQVKGMAVSFLNNLLRTLCSLIKQVKLLQLNPCYQYIPNLLPLLIKSSQSLMKSQPYYQIKDLSVLSTLDEVYSIFITTIKLNHFYYVFVQHKEGIIQDLIFRALILTPQDYTSYYQQPQQFINMILHVVQRDIKIKHKKDHDEDTQLQSFATLRTNAAEFLNTFCKYQDGTLTQIMQYAFLILQKNVNSEFTPSLMLIVLTILRDNAKERKDLHMVISNLVVKLLTEMEIPKRSTEEPENIQYSLVLLLLSKYYDRIKMVNPKIVAFSFNLCDKLLNDSKVQQVAKQVALDIIQVINHLQQGQPYSPSILSTFNRLITLQARPSHKILQSYFSLIKYNDIILKQKSYPELCETVRIIAEFIHKEIQAPDREQILINKLWNVIREIGENPEFIPIMVLPIEQAIMTLLPYVDGNTEMDFQEDILMLMSAFISKSHMVTENQLKMFQIIPKIFYNQYKAMFGHSFQTMQIFIYYGKQILKTSPAAINSIIHMCLTSISSVQYKGKRLSESDNCQGALLLQSLLIACGLVVDSQSYAEISNVVVKRLESKLKFDFLRSNLVALLSMVLIHNCSSFTDEQNQHILSIIFSNLNSFSKIKHSSKILIIALNKMLTKTQHLFIKNRFTQILDTIITLLQLSALKKNNLFEEDDDQQRDYQNSLVQTINDIMKMDQFQDFKNQIKILKEQHLLLIQTSVGELPQAKKDFLKHVLAVQRVLDQPRKIFTIKRNK